ncbi:MAG TPA: catalase [Minicystis sp.]|nr:catalase [Minicystis sp.]
MTRSELVLVAPVALALTLPLVACAGMSDGERRAALERSLHAIDPNAEPRPPEDPPEDGKPAFDTEYYLGSKSDEAVRFRAFMKQIQAIQDEGARDHHQPVQRGFHAKAHGCLHGVFRLAPDRAPRTRYGIFADGEPERPVWVRFSNGVGWKQADDALDARGMAVKVMRVPGKKYMADEQLTQDFLMTNSPTPVGKDAEEFMEFARANVNGRAAGIFFLLEHPRTAAPALLRTGAVDSMVTTQYWSGSAYHLGAHQAIKFTAKACPGTAARRTSHDDPNYLHRDLAAAAKQGVCMSFYVQFQFDPELTPIENASKEWDESVAPLVHVGDVVMPPQDIEAPGMKEFCQELSFNPWHALAEHKPMGHINRARLFVYGASAAHRKSGPEPVPYGEAPAPASPKP